MQFKMSMILATSPSELWDTLTDVARVSGCIPGCEAVEEVERLAFYRAVVKQKIGPFKLEVPSEIVVEEVDLAARVRTRASGRDKFTGTRLSVMLEVRLTAVGGGTELDVDADVDVQGRLATLGMPVIRRRAEQNFNEFETRLKTLLGAEGADAAETV